MARDECARDLGDAFALARSARAMREPGVLDDFARWFAADLATRGGSSADAQAGLLHLADAIEDTTGSHEAREVAAMLRKASGHAVLGPRPSEPLAPAARELVEALLLPDRAKVRQLLDDARRAGAPPAHVADTLIRPAMEHVGVLWSRGDIDVAQEHRATAIAQRVLARLEEAVETEGRSRAVVACVEGNLHSLGARLVAEAFEDVGWSVDLLGADVPTRDLVHFLREHPSEILLLSLGRPADLPSAKATIATLRRELGASCPRILVGGGPVRDFEQGVGGLDADEWFTDLATSLRDPLRVREAYPASPRSLP